MECYSVYRCSDVAVVSINCKRDVYVYILIIFDIGSASGSDCIL